MKFISEPISAKTAPVCECVRFLDLKWLFVFLAGLTMNSLMTTQADAAEHIEIVREVVLESGKSAMPLALAPTSDGGALVAGSFSSWTPWVTRVDAEGKVLWRHVVDRGARTSGVGDAVYTSAAPLPDDTVLAAGYLEIPEKGGP